MANFVPCKHIKSCSCLENKNDYLSGNGLYLYHDHKNCISSEHMKDFNTSGFFKVEGKPSWKFDCQFSFTPEEVEIIEEYYRRMGVGVCKCDKYYLCELCSHLTHRSFKNPKKYINLNDNCLLKSAVRTGALFGISEPAHNAFICANMYWLRKKVVDAHVKFCNLDISIYFPDNKNVVKL